MTTFFKQEPDTAVLESLAFNRHIIQFWILNIAVPQWDVTCVDVKTSVATFSRLVTQARFYKSQPEHGPDFDSNLESKRNENFGKIL
jgi:hypothetical protein